MSAEKKRKKNLDFLPLSLSLAFFSPAREKLSKKSKAVFFSPLL
jgi:hypothetical protein